MGHYFLDIQYSIYRDHRIEKRHFKVLIVPCTLDLYNLLRSSPSLISFPLYNHLILSHSDILSSIVHHLLILTLPDILSSILYNLLILSLPDILPSILYNLLILYIPDILSGIFCTIPCPLSFPFLKYPVLYSI